MNIPTTRIPDRADAITSSGMARCGAAIGSSGMAIGPSGMAIGPSGMAIVRTEARARNATGVSYAFGVNIHALMLADSAQAVDGKLYILGGAWNMLRFPTFPASLMVGIAVAIDVDWNETNHRHHLDIHFEDADGNEMEPRIGADFEAGRPPGAIAGAELRIVLAVNGPLSIPVPGSYAAVATIGGEQLARSRFQATQTSAAPRN
jgi:hypothetical protein